MPNSLKKDMESYEAAMHCISPKKSDANAILNGFQLPKIITANAKNPKPAIFAPAVPFAVVSTATKPPSPANAPEIVVPM